MIFALIVLSLFALCVLVTALTDALPALGTWTGRIGIGSLSPDAAREKALAVALRWLRRTPAVPISDQTRLTIWERLRGRYKSDKVQSWQQGALLLGVLQSGDTAAAKAFAETILGEDGRFRARVDRPDRALLAYALLRAGDAETLRPAMDEMVDFLSAQAGEGTVPYDPRVQDKRFVDTLGMVCPFLALYAKTYDCPEALSLCMRQPTEYAEKGVETKTGLPFHAIRVPSGAPLGVCGWGRGCGWYALSLAELLRCGVDVTDTARTFADALLPWHQKNGAFSRQLTAESGGESSATAMLGHFFAVLYRQTGEPAYRDAAEKAGAHLVSVTRRDGVTDFAQGDTKGIGYYSLRMSPMPALQGFALLLWTELQEIK